MSDEMIKWLISTGVGGLIGGIAMWQLSQFRKDMANLPDWLAAIHSRLSSLGADTLPPPESPPRRGRKFQRIQTAPTGWPVKRGSDDER